MDLPTVTDRLKAGRGYQRWYFKQRDGFALMATLWIVVAIAAVTFLMAESAHVLMHGARNRTNARIATWHALGCLSRTRAKLAEDLSIAGRPSDVWDSLDVYVPVQEDGCQETVTPSGSTLDVSHASARAVSTTLDAAGVDPILADSVMSLTVAGGHRSYGSQEEMQAAGNGLMRRVGADTLLGVDTGRVNAARMSHAVWLGATIDMLDDTTREHATAVATPGKLPTPASVGNGVSALILPSPDAWWLKIEASHGDPPVTVRVEAHLVLLGRAIGVEDIRL